MGQFIRSNGAIVNVAPKNGNDYSLDELQSFVGGYIEIVELDGGQIMVLNEEGKLIGLHRNDRATDMYRQAVEKMYGHKTYDYIAGDVLVCKSEEVR